MILGKQSIAGLALALFVATTLPAQAGAALLHGKKKKDDDLSTSRKPTPAQNALIDKAIVREKVVIKTIKERAPLVETYIQNMKPDPLLGQVPESDQHFLSRVDFKGVINDQTYAVNKETSQGGGGGKMGFFKHSLSAVGSLGGSLHLGPSARAGEFGHHTVAEDGPRCECGNHGCLELYAGARAIAAAAGATTFDETIARARDGDPRSQAALGRAGELIGLAIANVLIFLAPDRVIVGGGVAAAGELIFEPLLASVRERARVAPLEQIPIVPAELGPRAGAIGAALYGGQA